MPVNVVGVPTIGFGLNLIIAAYVRAIKTFWRARQPVFLLTARAGQCVALDVLFEYKPGAGVGGRAPTPGNRKFQFESLLGKLSE